MAVSASVLTFAAFAPMPGQAPMEGYYQVPASVLEDADALGAWAREATASHDELQHREKKGRKRAGRGD